MKQPTTYQLRRAQGRCVNCYQKHTKQSLALGSARCPSCAQKFSRYAKARRARHRLAGKCPCGAPPTKGFRKCAKCRACNVQSQKKARLKKRAKK